MEYSCKFKLKFNVIVSYCQLETPLKVFNRSIEWITCPGEISWGSCWGRSLWCLWQQTWADCSCLGLQASQLSDHPYWFRQSHRNNLQALHLPHPASVKRTNGLLYPFMKTVKFASRSNLWEHIYIVLLGLAIRWTRNHHFRRHESWELQG